MPVCPAEPSNSKSSQEHEHACSQDEELGVSPAGRPIRRDVDVVSV